MREHRKQGIFFQYEASCLTDSWQPFFVGLVPHGFLDDFKALIEIANVQRNEALFGEVIKNIWAAEIEGQAAAKESVGEFFCPVMRGVVILNGQMVAEEV